MVRLAFVTSSRLSLFPLRAHDTWCCSRKVGHEMMNPSTAWKRVEAGRTYFLRGARQGQGDRPGAATTAALDTHCSFCSVSPSNNTTKSIMSATHNAECLWAQRSSETDEEKVRAQFIDVAVSLPPPRFCVIPTRWPPFHTSEAWKAQA